MEGATFLTVSNMARWGRYCSCNCVLRLRKRSPSCNSAELHAIACDVSLGLELTSKAAQTCLQSCVHLICLRDMHTVVMCLFLGRPAALLAVNALVLHCIPSSMLQFRPDAAVAYNYDVPCLLEARLLLLMYGHVMFMEVCALSVLAVILL